MNLTNALVSFMEANWLPYEDSIKNIDWRITNGTINKEKLVSEYLAVTSEVNFDWISLARESQLLITPENYSNEDIKNYVKFLLQDYLFPEKVMTKEEIMELDNEVQKILKKHEDDNGWLYSYDVYDELIKLEPYKNLEYYNLWKLLDNENIENRYIEKKDREIGFLRLKS